MKKIAISIICPLIGALLMTSCLKDDDDTVLSSDVALLSFSIGDLKTTHTIQKENGEDSTYTTVMSGKAVKFTIDQEQRAVYNSDSILFGMDVTHVLVDVTADGGVCYQKPDGTLGSIEDSIDFTHPVIFRVTSHDGLFTRDYVVSLNVHKANPQKTSWVQYEEATFPANLFTEQKAFVKGDSLFVIGRDADGAYHVATASIANAVAWTATECRGVQSSGEGFSVVLTGDQFYLTAGAELYCSRDAIVWNMVGATSNTLTLLAVEEVNDTMSMVWGANADSLVVSSDMMTWQCQQPKKGVGVGVASFCQSLKTNESIVRTIFVATPEETDTCAQVWTKLSTEKGWEEIVPQGANIYGCPNLEHLAVIRYAGNMYAFGGKSVGARKAPLAAFGACYESRDNGVTWKENKQAFSLPETFEERAMSFSATSEGEYVWIMWSNGEVWRGRWNGLE